jgi:hypothetical protein
MTVLVLRGFVQSMELDTLIQMIRITMVFMGAVDVVQSNFSGHTPLVFKRAQSR